MKNIRTVCTIALIAVCTSQSVNAQNSISPQRLPLIEQEMFGKGNLNFVVADLMMDGLLQPGQDCAFLYKKGKISFQGNKLPANLEQKYQNRLNAFFTQQSLNSNGIYTVKLNNVTMNQMLDPNSAIRATTVQPVTATPASK